MNRKLMTLSLACTLTATLHAQKMHDKDVPQAVKTALAQKYPQASKITWEKEKANFEANWGGRSGEDSSVQFTPAGEFIEMVRAIQLSDLPPAVLSYVKANRKGAKITEAGKVTDAKGNISYEAEVNKKDLVFDEQGHFIKRED